jgi:HAD superfamily hydrolase (TIGR01549 family)
MIRGIIFDFDGVILESVEVKTRAFRKLFEKAFPEHVEAIVLFHEKNMGLSRFVKFRHIYEEIAKQPLSKEKETELGEAFTRLTFEEVLRVPFVAGARDFLDRNKNKYPMFVASGTPEEELREIVQKRDLSPYFKEVHGSPKSKKEIIGNILSHHQWKPENLVFVGDAESDYTASKETGIYFIARMNGFSQSLQDCEMKIKDLEELEAKLLRIGE